MHYRFSPQERFWSLISQTDGWGWIEWVGRQRRYFQVLMNAETKIKPVQSRVVPEGERAHSLGVSDALLRAFASAHMWLVCRSWPCRNIRRKPCGL